MPDDQNDHKPERGLISLGDAMQGLLPFLEQRTGMTPAEAKAATPTSLKKAPKRNPKIIKAAIEISERPDETEAAYLARELVQCTLPHRDPKTPDTLDRIMGERREKADALRAAGSDP